MSCLSGAEKEKRFEQARTTRLLATVQGKIRQAAAEGPCFVKETESWEVISEWAAAFWQQGGRNSQSQPASERPEGQIACSRNFLFKAAAVG